MPLVYFVLCHHSVGAVADLFRHIWRSEHHYVLHADRKSMPALHETLHALSAAFPNVHALPSVPCSWGGWSLVETTLRGIDRALALPGDWSHFILLSESHVPLVAPDAAAATLAPGVSYIEAGPVAAINPDGRADVLHRFTACYHEVPGVGMFATLPRALTPAFEATLHHGGQWIVLAHAACERLQARRGDAALWEPFRVSLLADETALQSLLLGGGLGQGLAIERRATTFVAWPHLSGNPDTTFSERNFHDARAQGYLFIRKRPAVLPEGVIEALAPMRMGEPLPRLPEPAERLTRGAEVAVLAAALHEALRGRFPALEVATLSPLRVGGSSTCYLQFRCPTLPRPLFVALVSEDIVQFKALLAWSGGGDDFRTGTLGGYPTSLLKVRLWDLFLQREVLLPDLPGGGFVTFADGERLGRLSGPIAHALDAGAQLATALAGR